jgi:signal transduction histidine kinase
MLYLFFVIFCFLVLAPIPESFGFFMQEKIENSKKYEDPSKGLNDYSSVRMLHSNVHQYYQVLSIILGIMVVFSTLIMYNAYSQKKKLSLVLEEQRNQIMDQKVQLEKLNDTKDRFFAIVSHDIKSPINTLRGFMNVFEKRLKNNNDNDLEMIIHKINQSLYSLNELVENLLDWANSQSGLLELYYKEINLSNAVETVFKLYKPNAELKEIYLKVHVDKDIIVYCDYNCLVTVLRNLISNALKFTPQNGVIEISAEKGNENVAVCIKDSGVGIPDKILENIFKIDFKYTSRGTANEKGTGLGLILCKELVEKNGGEIWVNSKCNEGCSFFFTLPLLKVQQV